ncbi:MAG: hypothetical protein M1826_006054 [Phylliscum demangeonii]|nr:MAG: hypothetical protein M1826_006054 [Phylliscum demangeonii]
MAYLPGFANGTIGDLVQPEDDPFLYALNFTQAFQTSQNVTSLLHRIEKTSGATNNIAPDYLDGTIFTNDKELFLYGGLLRDTDAFQAPLPSSVSGYELFQYGPQRDAWQPGFIDDQLPDGMTRYITAGAGVNLPSENLAFYFGGMRRPDWGEIRTSGRKQYHVTAAANTLISIDMSTMRKEKWTNASLPSTVAGRANAELAWIPTADQGALVAIGGVINPEWAFSPPSDDQWTQSVRTSPGFMSTVSVYDIKNQKWYNQATSGDTPPQLTQFCSVVTAPKDRSSYSVYIYGGYDGLNDTSAPIDDVYVLSVPSFIWTKAYTGTRRHGRRGHRCALVYPDQMMVMGGQPESTDTNTCLDGGPVQVFNLNSLKWQVGYDPKSWSEYKVPGVITAKIGGNADGGSQTRQPATWADAALSSLFAAAYSKTVPTYYPYASATTTRTDSPQPTRVSTILPSPVPHSSGVPSWVGPVIGVIVGLIAVTAIFLALFVWYSRRVRKRGRGTSDAGTSGFRYRIESWMQGTHPPKAPTITTATEGMMGMSMGTTALSSTGELSEKDVKNEPQEVSADQIHELPDTSRSELPAMRQIGFTPSSTMQFPRPRQSAHVSNPSSSSSLAAGIPRPESPTTAFTPGHRRQVSSLESSGFPSPPSTIASFGSGSPRERGNPLEEADLVSPVTPAEREHAGPPA